MKIGEYEINRPSAGTIINFVILIVAILMVRPAYEQVWMNRDELAMNKELIENQLLMEYPYLNLKVYCDNEVDGKVVMRPIIKNDGKQTAIISFNYYMEGARYGDIGEEGVIKIQGEVGEGEVVKSTQFPLLSGEEFSKNPEINLQELTNKTEKFSVYFGYSCHTEKCRFGTLSWGACHYFLVEGKYTPISTLYVDKI